MVQPSPPPTLLASRYRLERLLAQGGMAEVWLATDESLSRPVAVKILKPQLARDAVAAERFRREAIAVAGLNHPNIVAVYDAVEYDGQQAVVMQYVPGQSLREILDDERKLDVEQTLRIGVAVAGALDAAHAAGLVHRDVKPGNILITPDGRVLLTDFGIAKDTSGGDDLTSDNVMMGTAKYLSPEQVRGRRLDGRADLYSLGLVLYECLAGRVPFHGESDADTALARLQRDPTPLGRLRPTLPAGLTALVHRLLARDPAQRPTSGAHVRDAIERIRIGNDEPRRIDPLGPAATPASAPTTPPRPRPAEHEVETVAVRPRPPSATISRATPADGAGARPPGSRPDPPTPSTGIVRGRPHRKMQQRWAPPLLVIGGLLLAALVTGGVLWYALRDSDDAVEVGTPTSRPAADIAVETTEAPAAAPADLGVSSLSTFDPRGDQEENDDELGQATDGDAGTAWVTECYQNQYFGAKQGVGVVVKLNGPAQGDLRVTMASAPWNIDVYTSDSSHGDLASWGEPVVQDASQSSTDATFSLDDEGRYVLLMLREAARDTACSTANPFRSGFAEIAVP